jgi:hypothetical protein
MVNFPSGYALHLTTQDMVTEASYIGKISTDKKYSMSISNSVGFYSLSAELGYKTLRSFCRSVPVALCTISHYDAHANVFLAEKF